MKLEGWLKLNDDNELGISKTKNGFCDSVPEVIMDYFGYEKTDAEFGTKGIFIPNAHLSCWFSDKQCTLEEAQMNFESYLVMGNLLINGHYVEYSEWTITGFDVDCFIIGGHDLNEELKPHIGQYIHLILEV